MKKLSQKTIKNKLTVLWRIAVREKAGNRCEKCNKDGKRYKLDCHHILGKGAHPAFRWDVENGCLLCVHDHRFGVKWSAHGFPGEFKKWIITKRGVKWYENLVRRARSNKINKLRLLENWGKKNEQTQET